MDTTERLRLEIEVAAKEAIKTLTSTASEIKRLAQEAKAAVPPADELKTTMARVQAELKASGNVASFFDDKLGGLKERQAILRGAMVDLINKGIAPEAREIQDLRLEYDAAAVASKEMEQQTRVMSGSFSDLQGSIGAIAAVKAFTTIATGVLEAGVAAVHTAGSYEMLQANFETLTGSTAAAADEFNSLRQFANVTPFDLEGVAKSAQQLQAAKVPIADLTTRLGQLGDISLGNSAKFTSMVSAFSKMSVKGKVDLEQLNVVMEAGVPILDELATGYGKTTEAVFDMLSKGKVSTADFIAAMQRMTSEGGQFYGGMARGAQTYEGMLSTYKDSIDGVSASFGALMLPAVKAVLTVLTNLNGAIASSPLLKGMLAGVLVVAVALLAAWAIQMAAATVRTWLAYAAEMALNAARSVGNPLLIAAIAAVGLATAGYIAYASAQNTATGATKEASAQATLTAQAYRDMSAAMRDAADKTGNVKAAQEAVEKLRALRAQLAGLESQAASASSSVSSNMGILLSILKSPINPKATDWTEYKNEAEKIKAFSQSMNEISDKDVVNTIKRSKQFQDAMAKGSSTAITAALGAINGASPALQEQIDKVKAQIKEIESGTTILPTVAPPGPTLAEDAKKWAAAWKKSYDEYLASSSSDPYASIENERKIKLAEEAAADIGKIDKKTIDEINAYSDSKRKALTDKLAQEERAAIVKLTASKVDDLQLEQSIQIAALNDLETKAVAAAGSAQEQISAIHSKYGALRGLVEMKYLKQLTETEISEATAVADARFEAQKKLATETAAANAAYFDAANAQRAFDAKYSASKVDDLQLARDRELTLFVGTEDQKRRIALFYAKQIADARIDDARRVYQEELALSAKKGNWGEYAAKKGGDLAKDTEVGKMLGLGGQPAQSWQQVLLDSALSMAMQNESVQKVMNIFSTLLRGIVERVLPPLAKALTWLYDTIIVPVGNAIISLINAIIRGINKALGWLGVHIAEIAKLQTSAQIADTQARIAAKTEAVSKTLGDVQKIFEDRKKDLDDAYSKNISSLQNLLKLGAIGEADYASRVSTVNSEFAASVAQLETVEKAQLKTLNDILDELKGGTDVSNADLAAAGVDTSSISAPAPVDVSNLPVFTREQLEALASFSMNPINIRIFDKGTTEIPEDQMAIVHKGETIVPSSFSEGLRSGKLTLGKGGAGATIIYQTPIYVAGSVTSADALADTVATTMTRRLKRGQHEVAD